MDIEKGILQLLYYKDCVIIPGFGGFICNYVPARIKDDSQSFLPPSREIGFNPVMIKDDGLLAGYIARIEKISISESTARLDGYVDKLHDQLRNEGRYNLHSIGEFSYSRTGQLVFRASREVNFLPASYGLASFHFSLLEQESEHSLLRSAVFRHGEKQRIVPLPGTQLSKERQRSLRRVAMALPILVAISLLPLNSRNGLNKARNNAGVLPLPSLSVVEMPVHDESANAINNSEGNTPGTENINSVNPSTAETFNRNSYAIVAGSFSSEKNAETLKKELTDKGHHTEVWKASNGFFRVVIQAHESISSAQESLAGLQKEFEDIEFWILK